MTSVIPPVATRCPIVGWVKRSPGTRFVRLIAALGLALAGLLALAPAAAAEGDNWAITKYAMAVQVAEDGTAKISLDFDFDFGAEEGHGPYLVLPSRQAIPGDSEHWRSFPIELGPVTSSTGAPTDVDTETKNGLLAVKIGDENKEVSGLQSYHVEYTIRGLINPRAEGGLDELNWNVISNWEVPLRNVSIIVNGPADISAVKCFTGQAGSQQQCQASGSGVGSQFTVPEVPEGQGMTIVAGWPGGTFVGAEPILTKRHNLGNTFTANPITVGGGVLIAALGTGGLAAIARRRGRDERFTGLTPGLAPAAGADGAATTVGGSSGPVAVRFTPPDDARPGEVGTLIDEKAQQRDVTATVIDLAVRGHLRIAEVEPAAGSKLPGGKDWELTRLGGSDQLRGYESAALNGLFDKGNPLRMTEAMTGLTAAAVPAKLLTDVTDDRGWFKANPGTVRGLWIMAGCGIVVLGAIATAVLAATIGWGIIGLGIILLGVITFVFSGRMPARTATGTAMLDQAKGFRLYLETAEADQLKFEEGEDLFSRYLPYAIVFGVADRWAKIFADLAARGHDVPQPDWYVGPYVGAAAFYGSGGFSSSLDAFSSASSAAMTAASSGSGGGSGFGGGGSVGGGVGGGGGGGW